MRPFRRFRDTLPPFGYRVARIAGIDITIRPGWLLMLVVLSFYARLNAVGRLVAHAPVPVLWVLSLVFGLVFASFVVVHEMAHSLVARRYGLGVQRIMLFTFGGVSQLEGEARNPRAEFAIAVAGPLASLVLATVFAGIARTLNTGIQGLKGTWGSLAYVNVALALFNLLPAFPMDGGRLLRSALWAGLHDRTRATAVAAFVGRMFGLAMMSLGVFLTVSLGSGWNAGAFGGVWMIAIGAFLFQAAGAAETAEGGEITGSLRAGSSGAQQP